LRGTRIELRSALELRELPDVQVCPAGRLGSMATCELDGVPESDYRFGFASRIDTATLPIEGSIPLFGDHACNADATGPMLPNPYPSPPGPGSRCPSSRALNEVRSRVPARRELHQRVRQR
jgi:hypothetical protein